MKLISVNVGLPRDVNWHGKVVQTSIWKDPVAQRTYVSKLNIEGDRQSDLSVHGGADKAVYAYPSEHYSYWRSNLPDVPLPWALSARTSPPKDSSRITSALGTVSRLARLSSL